MKLFKRSLEELLVARDGSCTRVGFWYSVYEPHLPKPEPINWDSHIQDRVVAHLRSGKRHAAYLGWSECRVCGMRNGTLDLTDGVYIWPEGLAHYVEEHQIGLPETFVRHCLQSRT